MRIYFINYILISFELIISFNLKSQTYFNGFKYGNVIKFENCKAGIQLSNSTQGLISVGFNDPNGYYLSVDNTGTIITPTTTNTTNGQYQLSYASNPTVNLMTEFRDIVELEASSGLVAITGIVNNEALIMVLDAYGKFYCAKSFGMPSKRLLCNAITISPTINSLTGYPDIFVTGASQATGSDIGDDLLIMKLNYSIVGGTPTLTQDWVKIYDNNVITDHNVSPPSTVVSDHYNLEEGFDIMYVNSSNGGFANGHLYVVGGLNRDARPPAPLTEMAFGVTINESNGNVVSPSLNFLYAITNQPDEFIKFESVKYNYLNNCIYIGGDIGNLNGPYDFLFTKINSSGVVNWTKKYDINNYENFSSFLIANNNNNGNCYLIGSGDVGNGDVDVLLLKVDDKGFVLNSNNYGGSGDDFGNDISEDINGNYLTLHATSNSYNSNQDLELINVYYNGVTSCDFNGTSFTESSISPYIYEPGFLSLGNPYENNLIVTSVSETRSTLCFDYSINEGDNNFNSNLLASSVKNGNKKMKCYPTILADNNLVTFEIDNNHSIGIYNLKVIDNLGRLVHQSEINIHNKFEVNLGDFLDKGIYIIEIRKKDEFHSFKILK